MTTSTAPLGLPSSLVFEQSQSLTRHLQQCHAAQGRLFQAAAWAELAHRQVAPRFISLVSVAVVLLLACTW